ncbi:MAG: hypothetical protein R8P61_30490 [Bacteroidia bacterium]|nr:hypothetical protein [Bacteroidia bacterium]
MKLYFSLCLAIVIAAYLPYPMEYLWTEMSEDAIVIMGQACGCPCANARTLEEKLQIPDSILIRDPEIFRTQMNLVGNHPFKPFVFEIATMPLYVDGQIIGTDTILCREDRCEIAPEFEVSQWRTVDYFPRYKRWEDWQVNGSIFLIILACIWIIHSRFPKLIPWLWSKTQKLLEDV